MKKAIIVIQCRYDSSRAPGKILREFEPGVSMLKHLTDRLAKSDYNIIVATSDRQADLPIINEFLELQPHNKSIYAIHTGDYKNVLKRIYDAAEGFDYIIRVTGDDPFTDIEVLNAQASWAMSENLDYCFTKDMLRGSDCDIFKREALGKVLDKYPGEEIEHVEHFMNTMTISDLKIGEFLYPESYNTKHHGISLSVDTENDWKLAKIVYENLRSLRVAFDAFDIIQYFSRNQHLKEMNHKPLVSVYTVHKNFDKWMTEAADSVLAQVFTDYEYLIVDYGSDEMEALDTVLKFMHKAPTTVYRNRTLNNFIEAVQFTVGKCQGKYIMRVDADDILKPEALKTMVAYLQDHPFYAAVFSDYSPINDKGENIGKQVSDVFMKKHLPTCALIEKKRYNYVKYAQGQEFRDATSLLAAFDKYGFKVATLPESLFYYRIHYKSLTHGARELQDVIDTDKKARAANMADWDDPTGNGSELKFTELKKI